MSSQGEAIPGLKTKSIATQISKRNTQECNETHPALCTSRGNANMS